MWCVLNDLTVTTMDHVSLHNGLLHLISFAFWAFWEYFTVWLCSTVCMRVQSRGFFAISSMMKIKMSGKWTSSLSVINAHQV